ncbi:TetR/AcrR family transcriptional regulator [Sinomonas sp. ASV322]|uniref:TetR/AcrR family transcriptional regulator n=1 Tax=Sinomonas sp. ASV322 TaxID=3041920 RepID=UPI0027DD9B8B|nr:TetR/AcrR family transcriptional regulator [Sinomonas sp. ASV322]MDQ4501300.1 TetR/AcrR family transcriptional regulator [Sinomonas sp. ASV322]
MPAREKTTHEAIVAAGRELAERHGIGGLTMQAVAERVGVRAPSLYKRVRNRDELVDLVVGATIDDLTEALRDATDGIDDPREQLRSLGNALRVFGQGRPKSYELIFGLAREASDSTREARERAVAPLLSACAALVGAEQALDAARLVTAWANGFISMELTGSFQMGGDVDRAWAWALERIVGAL